MRFAVAWNRPRSPKGRATSIAPSRPIVRSRASTSAETGFPLTVIDILMDMRTPPNGNLLATVPHYVFIHDLARELHRRQKTLKPRNSLCRWRAPCKRPRFPGLTGWRKVDFRAAGFPSSQAWHSLLTIARGAQHFLFPGFFDKLPCNPAIGADSAISRVWYREPCSRMA